VRERERECVYSSLLSRHLLFGLSFVFSCEEESVHKCESVSVGEGGCVCVRVYSSCFLSICCWISGFVSSCEDKSVNECESESV